MQCLKEGKRPSQELGVVRSKEEAVAGGECPEGRETTAKRGVQSWGERLG